MAPESKVLAWMCLLVGINQLGFGAMIPALPLYAQSYGVSASMIGLAVGIYGLARFVVALPAGGLSDGLGRRPTLAIGGLLSFAGNIWSAWALSFPEFILARFVAGAGAGLVLTTGQVVLADISTPERRGRMIATYQGVFLFAVGFGPFPGGLMAEAWGLAAPFVFCGISSLLAATVAYVFVTETRDLGRTGSASTVPRPSFSAQLRQLSGHVGFVLVSLISFANAVVRTGGLFSIIPLLAAERLKLSVASIGVAISLGTLLGLIAIYPSGWLSDRYGRKAVIVPASLVMGASMIVFCWAPSYAWFVAACLVWGAAASISGASPAAYAADTAPKGTNASAMSAFRMVGDGGYVLGPLLLGFIADQHGAVTALLVAAALMVASGLAFALWAPESNRRQLL